MPAVEEFAVTRVMRHFESREGFALVSADRNERTPEENSAMAQQLEKHLRAMGKGFAKVRGGFVETLPDGSKKEVHENSYFIPKVDKKEAEKLAAHMTEPPFNQEAILWGNSKDGIHLLYKGGKSEHVANEFSMDQAIPYFTKFKQRKFAFVNKNLSPDEYRRAHGRCPDGFNYAAERHMCVKDHPLAACVGGEGGMDGASIQYVLEKVVLGTDAAVASLRHMQDDD